MATGIGETLRAARREQGRSLADAAAETRVRETYLAAMEQEDFTAIGGDVYAKGFLRSYAKALGLDPEPLLDAYRREYGSGDAAVPVAAQPVEPMRKRRQPATYLVVAAGAVVLVVLAAIGLLSDRGGGEQQQTSAPGPTPAESEPNTSDGAGEGEGSGATGQSPGQSPGQGAGESPGEGSAGEDDAGQTRTEGLEVAVSVVEATSWLRVTVDGETVLEGARSQGFTERFEGENQVVVRVGDASAVTVEANGEDQGSLGASGQVVVVTCTEGETACDVEVVPT